MSDANVENRLSLANTELKRRIALLEEELLEKEMSGEALQDSEKRYRRLFESAKDGILILDADTGKVVDVNPFLMQLLGYSYDALYGQHIWELGVFKNIAASKDAFKVLQENEYIRYDDLPLETIDGRPIAVEFVSNVYLVDHGKVIQCNIRDITERKRAEEALRESEKRYRLLAENVSDVIWMSDMNMRLTYLSPSIEKMTGYSVEEAMALAIEQSHTPESLKRGMEAVQEELEQEKDEHSDPDRIRTLELERYRKDGSKMWTEARMRFVRDSDGKPIGMLGISRDITERKKAEAALQEREKQLDIKSKNLEEVNTALTVLLKKRAEDQEEFQERVLMNLKELVEPYLEKLKKSQLDEFQKSHLEILESNLKDIVSPFARKLSSLHYGLTPTEIRVANLVKAGKTTKDIAEILNSTTRAVEFHRQSLRKKLGLQEKKANLQSHLLALL